MRAISITFFVLGVLASATAQCRGFCDEPPPNGPGGPIDPQPQGGDCIQERETWGLPGLGADGAPLVQPDFSSFRLANLIGTNDDELDFDLDLSELNPLGGGGPYATDVFELGVGVLGPVSEQDNHRVLTISALQGPLRQWSLQFNWLPAPQTWSIVSEPAPTPLASRVVQLPANCEVFNITIIPSQNWRVLNVRIGGIGSSTQRELWSTAIVGAFQMPTTLGSLRTPTHLRTGVLAGNLWQADMRTTYTFRRPNILEADSD